MAQRNKQFAIVTPLANEGIMLTKYCQTLFSQLEKLPDQFTVYFVIDKASIDNPLALPRRLARKYRDLQVIYAPENRHVVDAYLAGFRQALRDNCNYIIEMDAGFSHQPKEISHFVDKLKQGFDCVFGVRPLWSFKYRVPLSRRFFSLVGTVFSNLFLKTRLIDMTSGFEAFTTPALKKILATPLFSTGHFYQTEVRLRAFRLKLKTDTVPITYRFPSKSVNWRSLKNALTTFVCYLTH